MIDFTEKEIVFVAIAVTDLALPAFEFFGKLDNEDSFASELAAYVSGDLEKALYTAKQANAIMIKILKQGKLSETREAALEEAKQRLEGIEYWESRLKKYKHASALGNLDDD